MHANVQRNTGLHSCHVFDTIVFVACTEVCTTYSLGFFLGPGRPRSLGGAFGSIEGGARLRPDGFAPRFLLLSAGGGGGANELGPLAAADAGVELESDDFSISGGCTDGDASFLMVVAGVLVDGHLLRCVGDSLSVISRLLDGWVDMVVNVDEGVVVYSIAVGDEQELIGRLEVW